MNRDGFQEIEQRRIKAAEEANKLAFRHERRYKLLQYIIIGFSAATTLSVALGNIPQIDWIGFRITATVASVVASTLIVVMNTFSHKEKAAYYDDLYKKLDSIDILYQNNSGVFAKAKNTEEKRSLYVEQNIKLLSQWRTRGIYGKLRSILFSPRRTIDGVRRGM